jgi:hypothetical protein
MSDSQWIDVDAVISTMTLTYIRAHNLYILDENDANTLNSFLVNWIPKWVNFVPTLHFFGLGQTDLLSWGYYSKALPFILLVSADCVTCLPIEWWYRRWPPNLLVCFHLSWTCTFHFVSSGSERTAFHMFAKSVRQFSTLLELYMFWAHLLNLPIPSVQLQFSKWVVCWS